MNTTALIAGLWLCLGAELYAREMSRLDPQSIWPYAPRAALYITAVAIVPFLPLLYGLYVAVWLAEPMWRRK